jgi:hypothetical protein
MIGEARRGMARQNRGRGRRRGKGQDGTQIVKRSFGQSDVIYGPEDRL